MRVTRLKCPCDAKAETEEQLKSTEERYKIREESKAKIIAFPTLWRRGTPIEQKRLLRTIFQYLMPTSNSLQIFYWLNEPEAAPGKSQNEKRDTDLKSASLIYLPVVPSVGIPAINLNGVLEAFTAISPTCGAFFPIVGKAVRFIKLE